YFPGSIATGNVVVHGESLAFCNQPLCGSITFGRSAYGWVVVQSVVDEMPGTMPDQSRSGIGRAGVRPPNKCMMWPSTSAYITVKNGICNGRSAASKSGSDRARIMFQYWLITFA